MKYKLKCTGRFPRNFVRGGRIFTAWYETWAIIDKKGKFVYRTNVTSDTYLCNFLSNLLGHRDDLTIDERQKRIFECVFEHSNRWKLFSDAWDILNKKGSEEALAYLEDKFSVLLMMDKLGDKRR